jgi:hypothetical protein
LAVSCRECLSLGFKLCQLLFDLHVTSE